MENGPSVPGFLNLYSYVRNRPTVMNDPSGHLLINGVEGSLNMSDRTASILGGSPTNSGIEASGILLFSQGAQEETLDELAAEESAAGANQQQPTAEDIATGNFIVVGERPLLPDWPVDTWYHMYLEIPVVEDGKWTGEFNTYGVLGDIKNGKGTSDNQQVRANDPLGRNGDKPGSDRNHQYDVRVNAAQRTKLEEGARYWTRHECPECGSHYVRGGPASARPAYNSNTWVYNMLIHNPAGRIEPPGVVPSPGWKVNDVGANYYPQ